MEKNIWSQELLDSSTMRLHFVGETVVDRMSSGPNQQSQIVSYKRKSFANSRNIHICSDSYANVKKAISKHVMHSYLLFQQHNAQCITTHKRIILSILEYSGQ